MTWLEIQQTSSLATLSEAPQVCDISFRCSTLIYTEIVRALRSTISPKDHDKIKALFGDFGKLKDEFDRAVNVEALTVVRRIGKYFPCFGKVYLTDTRTLYDRGIASSQTIKAHRSRKLSGETQLYEGNTYYSTRRHCHLGNKCIRRRNRIQWPQL
jgi:hypothetical protein